MDVEQRAPLEVQDQLMDGAFLPVHNDHIRGNSQYFPMVMQILG